ncbi:hypothetical protein NKG94_20635 [Micromonospora sp. M12]
MSDSTVDGLYLHHTRRASGSTGRCATSASPTTSSSTRSPTRSTSTPASPTPGGAQLRPQHR